MLLSDKSIALINPEHARFTPKPRKHLIDRRLQESLILGDFQAKNEVGEKEGQNEATFWSAQGGYELLLGCPVKAAIKILQDCQRPQFGKVRNVQAVVGQDGLDTTTPLLARKMKEVHRLVAHAHQHPQAG